jgi:hypothetical protein
MEYRRVVDLLEDCFTVSCKRSTARLGRAAAKGEMKREMRKKLLLLTMAVLALGALTAAGFAMAAGEGPVTVTSGNIKVVANGSFSPKALSKTKLTPITLSAEGKISTLDGTHPPAIEEVLLETDKNGSVNVKGLPTCRLGQLQSTDTAAAEKACGTALVGTGTTTVEVQFPEQNPINVNSKLLVFNGGESGGKTTLYIHAYFNAPITGAIVTTVKISKIHKGRFGLLADATIPKIAGGSGSVTSFALKLNKGIKYKGKTYNPFSAKCTDGKLVVNAIGKFSDGTTTQAEIVRACTSKG